MKLKDLKIKVDWAMEQERNHDLEVCIPNNKGGQGGLSVTLVRGANPGIDWDRGKFLIWPENEMIEKPLTPKT